MKEKKKELLKGAVNKKEQQESILLLHFSLNFQCFCFFFSSNFLMVMHREKGALAGSDNDMMPYCLS